MAMEHLRKHPALYAVLTVYLGIAAIGGYAKVWEYRQPIEEIRNAVVRDIRPYNHKSEISLPSYGNMIHIEGESRAIDFPSNHWDETVKPGDSVDLVVRRSFPLFSDNLDGMKIDDYK